MQHADASQQVRLEAAVIADPGATDFAALAELYRRGGRLADAEAVARAGLAVKPDAWEGRVALALVLLDRGLAAEAQLELSQLIEAGAAPQGSSPSDIAQGAEPLEPSFEASASEDSAEELAAEDPAEISVGAPFATGTMADLLERQGDVQGALRIRAALDPAHGRPDGDPNAQIIQELSRWLANAQQRIGERA